MSKIRENAGLLADISTHAAHEAFDTVFRICDTAGNELRLPALIGALACIEDKCREMRATLAEMSPEHLDLLNHATALFEARRAKHD